MVRTLRALWECREATRGQFGQPEKLSDAGRRFEDLLSRIQGKPAAAKPQPAAAKPAAEGMPAKAVVDTLLAELMALPAMTPQPRGYASEKFLRRLFDAFGLEARDAFKLKGEQIDGSFLLSNETYLLEAKWQDAPCGVADLHAFHGKVEQKAAWTRGLFVSNSRFSLDGLSAFGRGKRLSCMDGYDLYEALQSAPCC